MSNSCPLLPQVPTTKTPSAYSVLHCPRRIPPNPGAGFTGSPRRLSASSVRAVFAQHAARRRRKSFQIVPLPRGLVFVVFFFSFPSFRVVRLPFLIADLFVEVCARERERGVEKKWCSINPPAGFFQPPKLIQEHASTASKMRLERSFVFVRTIVWTRIFHRRCSPGRFGCLGVRATRRLRDFTVRRILKIPKFVAQNVWNSNSTRRKRFLSEARPRRREIPYRRKKKDAHAERRKNDDDDRARAFFMTLFEYSFLWRDDSIRENISPLPSLVRRLYF